MPLPPCSRAVEQVTIARVSRSKLQILAGKVLVERLVRELCEARGIDEPDLEWVPEDQDLQFHLRVTVAGPTSARLLKLPRAPLEDRDVGTLARLVRDFVWQIPPR